MSNDYKGDVMTDIEDYTPAELYATIERVGNGFIVSCPNEEREVFEEIGDGVTMDGIQDAFTTALYNLAERMGFEYNKFRSDNLRISWDRKGSKVEGNDDR